MHGTSPSLAGGPAFFTFLGHLLRSNLRTYSYFRYLQQLLQTLYDARFRLPFAAAHAPLFVGVPGLCVYLLR